jgi:hypothetical protein
VRTRGTPGAASGPVARCDGTRGILEAGRRYGEEEGGHGFPSPTERDEWLNEVCQECTFGDAVGYTGTLEEHGLYSLDAVELCIWIEARYNISYEKESTDGFLRKTLWQIRCDAEAIAAKAKKR